MPPTTEQLVLKSLKIKQRAGLVQIYATTNIVGNIIVNVVDSGNNTVVTSKSLYPNIEHLFAFWLPNDIYSFNFSVQNSTAQTNANFVSWGQTNINFLYLSEEKNPHVKDFSGNLI